MVIVFAVMWMMMPQTPRKNGSKTPRPGATPALMSGDATTTGSKAQMAATSASPASASRTAPDEEGGREVEAEAEAPGEIIPIRTRVFDIGIDTRGARPRHWAIIAPEYTAKQAGPDGNGAIELIPQIVRQDAQRDLPLEVTFKEKETRSFARLNSVLYDCRLTTATDGATVLRCVSQPVNDLRLIKTYTFRPDSYVVGLEIQLENLSESPLPRAIREDKLGFGLTLGPGIGQYDPARSNRTSGVSYTHGAVASDKEVFDLSPGGGKTLERYLQARWIALKNKSFAMAVVSPGETTRLSAAVALQRTRNELPRDLAKTQSPPYTIIAYTAPLEIPTSGVASLNYQVFAGPMKRTIMDGVGYGFHRVLFHNSWGWFRWLCLAMMSALDWFHQWSHNYGIAIILLTVLVRILMYPPTHYGFKLNAKTQMEMAKIKPELTAINEKYKDDFQARNKATMEVYKKHGINPMAPLRGCLPMLIQIPIFFALYKILDVSIDLRGASFLWIHDLSMPDRLFMLPFTIPLLGWNEFNLLPILMALTTVLTQLLSTTQINDPNQKMMLYMMPIMLLFMLYNLSSGLFVYWITSNIWQAAQQAITNRIVKREVHPAPA